MIIKHWYSTAALYSALWGISLSAQAQVIIDTTIDGPVNTSTAGAGDTASDITITSSGQVSVTSGSGVLIDSDNLLINQGTITASDVDNVVGVELQGGRTGSFTNSGQISLTETFTPTDTNGDNIIDGRFASGAGRTAILISGNGSFSGSITQESTAGATLEGNRSRLVHVAEGAGVQGNINWGGTNSLLGDESVAIDLAGRVDGDVNISGTVSLRGENAQAVVVSDGIDGSLSNSGTITNTGYRLQSRPTQIIRDLLDAEDVLQAGAAIDVRSDIGGGIFLVSNTASAQLSLISQIGQAPAIRIAGTTENAVTIGQVAASTDTENTNLHYGLVNQGQITAAGIYNDINALALSVEHATLQGGFSNTGGFLTGTFRSGDSGSADISGQTGLARAIYFGAGANVLDINNSGLISAQVTEAADEIYGDTITLAARLVEAITIDIAESAQLQSLTNSGTILAALNARTGQATAILDRSGTLREITNSGAITVVGTSSDSTGQSATGFELVALDLSTNQDGITLTQTAPDAGSPITASSLVGDVMLGSGDDVITINAGSVSGDWYFGDGQDRLSLSDARFTGNLIDSDGSLELTLVNAALGHTRTTPVRVRSAYFDSESTFSPILDGISGQASSLLASGNVVFETGASIAPVLNNIIGAQSTDFVIIDAQNLSIDDDLSSFITSDLFLYDIDFSRDPENRNRLLLSLRLRDMEELGLDEPQAAIFTSVIEALGQNSELASAIVNSSTELSFNVAINQLLPEFSAASRQYVAANIDSTIGAIGSHLDLTRRAHERPGGIWFEEFAYFADREKAALSEQYRGFGFGFSSGLDTAFGPFHALGINLSVATTEIEDVLAPSTVPDDPLSILTVQAGIYGGLALGPLGFEFYGGGGYNDFESTRLVDISDFFGSVAGDWGGYHYNGSARLGLDLNFTDHIWIRPLVAVDYLSLNEQAYTEVGDIGLALDIDERTVEVATASAVLNIGAKFQGQRTWVRPMFRGGYRTEILNDPVVTTGRFTGQLTPFTITGAEFPKEGFIVGFSLAAGSEFSAFAIDLDSEFREGFIRHTARLVFRLLF